jgi:hypothetical protein
MPFETGVTRMRLQPFVSVCLAAALAIASAAAAQDVPAGPRADEIQQLRAEIAELRAEVEALRDAVLAARGRAPASNGTASQPPADDPRLAMLQVQVAELARSKVESESRFPVRLFGTIHSHMFANSGEPNWLDAPNIVQPGPPGGHTGSFSASLRQTRIGIAADGPAIGGARTSAVVAADFFGGMPGFQTGQVMPLPRLLLGFARIETDRFAFQAGQDHVILAPRDPSSIAAFAFPLLFRSGNLYLRAPQARVEASLSPQVRLMAGITAPIGGDVPGENYRFVPPALGGERSRHPALQAHLGYASDPDADALRRIAVGVSGHFGRERRDGRLADSWAGALDLAVRHDRVGVAGEAFAGRNIDAFGGATGLDARAQGGWAELQLFPTPRLTAAAGFGVDRLKATLQPQPRRGNRSAYGSIRFAVTPEVEAGFEYNRLVTRPGAGVERRNHHFDWVFLYRF